VNQGEKLQPIKKMTPELWKKIEDLYHTALERDRGERAAFLDRACTDPEVRRQVEILLGQSDQTSDFLERPALNVEAASLARNRSVEKPLVSLPSLGARYEVIEEVGHGGMGTVYKARDRETDEIVALKVLNSNIASDHRIIDRFKTELRLARKVTHKNVCRIYDLNHAGNTTYISMEFVEGESLRRLLSRMGGLTVRKGIEMIRQLCEGLREAHAAGIIHRDLKPENIMVDQAGNVKIMDFGIARLLSSQQTSTGGISGTPAYMSPEQAEGRTLDIRSDIYSLGLIMYEIFTGRIAFSGDTPVSVALKQVREKPPAPRSVEPLLPVELEQVILRCLEKNPEKRFNSLEEIEAALRSRPEASAPSTTSTTETKISTWFSESAYVLAPNPARTLLLLVQAGYLTMYGIALFYLEPASRVFEREFGLSISTGFAAIIACVLPGIASRLYLMSGIALNHPAIGRQFWRLFPALLLLDEIWAASPFLLAHQIGIGAALASTALLAYLPFSQKTLAYNAYR
jgi:serine/threonine protein kinase